MNLSSEVSHPFGARMGLVKSDLSLLRRTHHIYGHRLSGEAPCEGVTVEPITVVTDASHCILPALQASHLLRMRLRWFGWEWPP